MTLSDHVMGIADDRQRGRTRQTIAVLGQSLGLCVPVEHDQSDCGGDQRQDPWEHEGDIVRFGQLLDPHDSGHMRYNWNALQSWW